MRNTGFLALSSLIVLGLIQAAPVQAMGQLADVQVYDRKESRILPIYEHHGRYYVVGEPGNEYQITLNNSSGGRILAIPSVDGVNALTGETASPNQSGYVLGPYDSLEIAGWRTSMSKIAAFFFTTPKNSYAGRTGRPNDVGVIGVALFRERDYQPPQCCWQRERGPSRNELDASPAAEATEANQSGRMDAPQKKAEKLGTGYGRSENSEATHTTFERASSTPDEVIALYYDSYKNLVAQGVIPQYHPYRNRRPQPFPGGFVPPP